MNFRVAYTNFSKSKAVNPNIGYRIFLSLFAFASLIFLSSTYWLPSSLPIQNTELGTAVDAGSGMSLTLKENVFNPSTEYLSVSFKVENLGQYNNKFTLAARKNTEPSVLLDAAVAFYGDGFLVVDIQNVGSDWELISLWIYPPGLDEETEIYDESLGANVIIDSRTVEKDKNTKRQTEKKYRVSFVKKDIEAVTALIADCRDKIQKNTEQIKTLEHDIETAKENQKYLTEEEVRDDNFRISDLYAQINSRKEDTKEQKISIKDYEEKIKKLEVKLSDIEKGL